MSNHYLLPVCFATAAHGALLFGFTKHHRPMRVEKESTIETRIYIAPPEEPPPMIEDAGSTKSTPTTPPDRPLPRQTEPLVVQVADQLTITPPEFPNITTGEVTKVIDDSVFEKIGTGKTGWGNVVTDGMLDNPPRTRFQAAPIYPHEANRAGMRGEVVVEFLVDGRGRVSQPRVVSSTHRIFEDATLRAVSKWQFEPGKRGGKTVSFQMAVPVVFNLNE
jgi:periplasmic protein TonB